MESQRLITHFKPIVALSNTTPSSSTPTRVSLKNYSHITIVVSALNSTTVTGSAITLKQSTDVAGTGEKALSFTKAWRNIDTAAADALTEFTVSSDTFTTDSTNSKSLLYVIEVNAEDLDATNSFDCIRLGTANATATTLTVNYYLGGPRYPQELGGLAAITD